MDKICINKNWFFHNLQTGETKFVNLPHDATISSDRDPNLQLYFLSAGFKGGRYEYIQNLLIDTQYSGKAMWLHFDGVYRNASIFVNGEKVWLQEYGYTQFDVRIEDYLHFGENNEIKVIIDTPCESHSRWYAGSGIYRSVYLCIAEKTHISPYGVKVTTINYSPAQIRVDTETEGNDYDSISVEIFDGDNLINKAQGGSTEITVDNAKLWTSETPHLYTAKVTLVKNGQAVDIVEEKFGIRLLEWSAEKGFLVNGQRTLLKGGCIHADNGILGMVTNSVTEERRVKNLKKSGFNAIRSAHHPMSADLLAACDKYGMYVMDELYDTWYRMKQMSGDSLHFMRTFEDDTTAMINNDYNHPCVVMYSIGNEIPEIGSLKAVKVAKRITQIIKDIDKTRPLVMCPSMNTARAYVKDTPYMTVDEDEYMAQSEENKNADLQHYIWVYTKALSNNPTAKIGSYPQECIEEDEKVTNPIYSFLDMAGYNYYTDKFEKLHELHPERLLVATETRGNLIVNNWKLTKENNYIVGDFIWTLQDHIGETNVCGRKYADEPTDDKPFSNRAYPWILNDGGVIDLSGNILPAIHRYKFAWGGYKGLYLASQPPVHNGIAPDYNCYKWTDTIESWSYDGYEGKKTFIDVYSDAYEVEVFINGKSIGRQPPKDYFAKFPAVYEAGEVIGVGYDKYGKEIYRTVLKSAKSQTKLSVLPDKTVLKADGEDFSFIEISITDEDGIAKSLPNRAVTVKVTGAGELVGLGSANPLNTQKYTDDTHITYSGKLLAVIRSGVSAGNICVTVSSADLKEQTLELTVKE